MATTVATEPFSVDVPDAALADLRERLHRTRWPDTVEGVGWDYGTDLDYLRELCAYWADEFDWHAQEAMLNALPQFRTRIGGAGVHYAHVRSPDPDAIPLLLLHGWPSTFAQMVPIVALLTHGTPAFHCVVPSLPGYGFSDRPSKPGMGVGRMAELLAPLMTDVLGYRRYAVRASDLGAGVATAPAIGGTDAVIGLHLSGTNPFVMAVPDDLSAAEREFVQRAQRWMQEEMAYAMVHTTRPQTLAPALNDSPAGLASWIVEKFRRWSDHTGDVEEALSKDAMLTHLTIYWATQTIGSSMRLYLEAMRNPSWGAVVAPTAHAQLPGDMFPTPREWAERQGPVARWTTLERGGHFGEQEVPDLLAEDLRAFFAGLA
jgi:pimeloyl-ACP methyl ester carboxylesterase